MLSDFWRSTLEDKVAIIVGGAGGIGEI